MKTKTNKSIVGLNKKLTKGVMVFQGCTYYGRDTLGQRGEIIGFNKDQTQVKVRWEGMKTFYYYPRSTRYLKYDPLNILIK